VKAQAGALEIVEAVAGKGAVCETILRSLPDWFGIEEAILGYVRDVESMPMLVARSGPHVAGFLSFRHHFPWSAEIHVMGVLPERHRAGVGRGLVASLEERLRLHGVELLQVKTLGPSRACPEYERTRAFYEAMGFRPLEEMPRLWGEANPCLLMIKPIATEGRSSPPR